MEWLNEALKHARTAEFILELSNIADRKGWALTDKNDPNKVVTGIESCQANAMAIFYINVNEAERMAYVKIAHEDYTFKRFK